MTLFVPSHVLAVALLSHVPSAARRSKMGVNHTSPAEIFKPGHKKKVLTREPSSQPSRWGGVDANGAVCTNPSTCLEDLQCCESFRCFDNECEYADLLPQCVNPIICSVNEDCCVGFSCLQNECEHSASVCNNPRMCSFDWDCCKGYVCFENECEFIRPHGFVPTETPAAATPTEGPTPLPSQAPTRVTYVPGDLTVEQNGLLLSTGLTSRIIARTGQPVALGDGSSSAAPFHDQPDAGATFEDTTEENRGGWAFVSNSEVRFGGGGVGSITFDAAGEPIKYQMVLTDTSRNCGGGRTYWNTWVSCEENGSKGQIWEVDPFGKSEANMTAMGGTGGNFESMAYDDRDPKIPRFFVTHDTKRGEIRRFTPDAGELANGTDHAILTTPGTIEYLVLTPDPDHDNPAAATNSSATTGAGTFYWTRRRSVGKDSAEMHFRNCEGIDVQDGVLLFVSKRQRELFILDLDGGTYIKTSTRSGAFDGRPDQIVHILDGGGSEADGANNSADAVESREDDLLYFTEEGGHHTGIHGRDRRGNYLTIVETPAYRTETTGLAFSPDATHLYFAVQGEGVLFDVTREDGLPFGGRVVNVKHHHVDDEG